MISALLRREPSTRASTTNWVDWHTHHRSTAGAVVNSDSALLLPAVWQAILMISGDLARLPLNLYRVDSETNEDEVARSHPAHRAVRRIANSEMVAHNFWRQLIGDALLWNNAYAWIRTGGDGRPVELIPLLPDRTGPYRTTSGELLYITEVHTEPRRQYESFNPAEILHIRGLMLTRCDGSSPTLLHYAREALGLALAAQDFQSKFFQYGMRSSGILEIPRDFTKKGRDTLEEGFRRDHEGSANWFKTIILRDGAKFHSQSQTNSEAESHQLREDQVREVARMFNLPPSKLGLSDSVSYNSKSEDNQSYYETTLAPWAAMITNECWFKLLLPGEQSRDVYKFEHDATSLLRMNLYQRNQAYEIAVNPNRGGWMLKSEVRQLEGLPEIEGIDDPPETPTPPALPPPEEVEEQPYGRNEARDRWLTEHRDGYTLEQLTDKLATVAKNRRWTPIGPRGIAEAIKKYKAHSERALAVVND